ncbi:unnamed protein product, partial [Rotaria sp. Silwood1]
MRQFFLYLLVFSSVYFSSNNAIKVGCRSYEPTGKIVAGGDSNSPLLNKFIADRFYVDDSKNIYLFDRSPSNNCPSRFLLWSTNSSQGSFLAEGCTSDASSTLQDVLVSPDGKYKTTGFGFGSDVVYPIRRVNGQNGFMLRSIAIVDNEKNIYSLGYSYITSVLELRKWTPANSIQDGTLIDFDQSIWGISAFFVDSKGSVYIVGPNYVSIKKWTGDKFERLIRNPMLNRPTSVLVDNEGNIYIGERNQITLWPAKSNESFTVVKINGTNGILSNKNYRNMIQMDNDGSLYLLSTDQDQFGSKILKYRCSNCTSCITDNLFKTYNYSGNLGPLHVGTLKMSQYTGWSDLVGSGIATNNEKEIIMAVAQNEGNLDSVQAYDSEVLTAGAMQKTVKTSKVGEFEQQVFEFKQENPRIYSERFETCGWEVSSNKKMSFRGKTGLELKRYLRAGFDKVGKVNSSEALGPIVCAIKTPEFQLKQMKDFIKRLQEVLQIIPNGFNYTISDYFKSLLGQATALDQHVNRPGYVRYDVGKVLNHFYVRNPRVSKNPRNWTDQQRSTYEREILEDYGV